MSSNELQQLIDNFNKQGQMAFLKAATKEKITMFENEKSVILPDQYKKWLMFSDGGELFLPAGIQLYGIEHKPKIDINDDSRPSEEYIVIGAFASGDPILCEKNGDKIVIYNQEIGKVEDDLIFPDFFSFLKDIYELLGMED